MPELLLLLGLAAACAWFLAGLRVRELALVAARRGCARAGAQLLDQSVSAARVSLSRDERGRWRVWRQYTFEYSSDGERRETGHVIMLGGRLRALVMAEPGRVVH